MPLFKQLKNCPSSAVYNYGFLRLISMVPTSAVLSQWTRITNNKFLSAKANVNKRHTIILTLRQDWKVPYSSCNCQNKFK